MFTGGEKPKPIGAQPKGHLEVDLSGIQVHGHKKIGKEKKVPLAAGDMQKAAGDLSKTIRGGPEKGGVLASPRMGERRVPHDTSVNIDGVNYSIRMIDRDWSDLRLGATREGWLYAGEERGSAVYARNPEDREAVRRYLSRIPATTGDVQIGMRAFEPKK